VLVARVRQARRAGAVQLHAPAARVTLPVRCEQEVGVRRGAAAASARAGRAVCGTARTPLRSAPVSAHSTHASRLAHSSEAGPASSAARSAAASATRRKSSRNAGSSSRPCAAPKPRWRAKKRRARPGWLSNAASLYRSVSASMARARRWCTAASDSRRAPSASAPAAGAAALCTARASSPACRPPRGTRAQRASGASQQRVTHAHATTTTHPARVARLATAALALRGDCALQLHGRPRRPRTCPTRSARCSTLQHVLPRTSRAAAAGGWGIVCCGPTPSRLPRGAPFLGLFLAGPARAGRARRFTRRPVRSCRRTAPCRGAAAASRCPLSRGVVSAASPRRTAAAPPSVDAALRRAAARAAAAGVRAGEAAAARAVAGGRARRRGRRRRGRCWAEAVAGQRLWQGRGCRSAEAPRWRSRRSRRGGAGERHGGA
jgi:hypothetical protein